MTFDLSTMNGLFDRYWRDHVPTLAPTTQRQIAGHLKVLRPVFGHRVPREVIPRDIGQFLDVDHAKQHRNKIVATLSGVFSLAVGRWFVDGCNSNPCAHIKLHPSKPRDRLGHSDKALTKRVYDRNIRMVDPLR